MFNVSNDVKMERFSKSKWQCYLSDCLDGSFLNYCATKSIQAAANYLRDKILNKFKDLPELDWPPSLEQLSNSA